MSPERTQELARELFVALLMAGSDLLDAQEARAHFVAVHPADDPLKSKDKDAIGLTPLQSCIARMISEEGVTNERVGERLGMTLDAVKGQVTRIFRSLQITSRSQILQALRGVSA